MCFGGVYVCGRVVVVVVVVVCVAVGGRGEGGDRGAAALGVIKRPGNERMRHVRVGQLWIQEKEESEGLKFQKVDGEVNPGVRNEDDFGRTDSNDELHVCLWESQKFFEAPMSDHWMMSFNPVPKHLVHQDLVLKWRFGHIDSFCVTDLMKYSLPR